MKFLETIMQHMVTPLLLIGILGVGTLLLLTQRDLLKQGDDVVLTPHGDAVAITYFENTDEWVPYYGGGNGPDDIVAVNAPSLRVTTGGDGGWYGARTGVGNVNLEDTVLRFMVRANDWEELQKFVILFASDNGEFQHYYGLDLRNFYSNPEDGEWVEVAVDTSEFQPIEGAPDWKNITDVAVRVIPEAGVATRVWVDEFSYVEKTERQPMVTLAFDDGFDSVFDAHEEMQLYGYTGTLYVIPELLNTSGYLTQGLVDSLHTAGWDVSGHGNINLRALSSSDVDTELARAYEYGASRGYRGFEHFAYPNGSYDAVVRSQVREYFTSGRTIDGFLQPQDYVIPSAVNARTVSSETPLDDILEWIDEAEAEGSWLIIVWHDIVDGDPNEDVEYNMNDFVAVLDYLQEQQMDVVNYSEGYLRMTEPELSAEVTS